MYSDPGINDTTVIFFGVISQEYVASTVVLLVLPAFEKHPEILIAPYILLMTQV